MSQSIEVKVSFNGGQHDEILFNKGQADTTFTRGQGNVSFTRGQGVATLDRPEAKVMSYLIQV